MNKLRFGILFTIIFSLSAIAVFGQYSPSSIVKKELSQEEINKIVSKSMSNEAQFREALKNYVFNRFATIQSIGFGGQITGEYRRDSFMNLKPNGERFEKILFHPVPTTKGFDVTPQDIDDIVSLAMEPSEASQYNFTYIGMEKIDELNLYVFDVEPKVMPNPKKTDKRVYVGRIWIDDRDLLIVKTKGKTGPETKDSAYPVVETWRENVDGKFWFPSYAYSNDELVFGDGSVVRMKLKIRYTDYRQGSSEVKILDDDVTDVPETKPTPTPTPAPKKP